MATVTRIPSFAFTCLHCGRYLVQLTGDDRPVCGACRVIPGWHKDPRLRKVLIPNEERDADL